MGCGVRRRLPCIMLLAATAACGAKTDYQMSWTIEEAHAGASRQLLAASEGQEVPIGWTTTGDDVRVLEEAPRTPHDTIGFLYWWHSEVPLKMNVEETHCETVSRPGSVATSRVCASAIYSVEAECDEGCRRDIIRVVADSLGAMAIVVAEERLEFEGEDGEPASVPQTYAQNEGFRGTYVMIRME